MPNDNYRKREEAEKLAFMAAILTSKGIRPEQAVRDAKSIIVAAQKEAGYDPKEEQEQ